MEGDRYSQKGARGGGGEGEFSVENSTGRQLLDIRWWPWKLRSVVEFEDWSEEYSVIVLAVVSSGGIGQCIFMMYLFFYFSALSVKQGRDPDLMKNMKILLGRYYITFLWDSSLSVITVLESKDTVWFMDLLPKNTPLVLLPLAILSLFLFSIYLLWSSLIGLFRVIITWVFNQSLPKSCHVMHFQAGIGMFYSIQFWSHDANSDYFLLDIITPTHPYRCPNFADRKKIFVAGLNRTKSMKTGDIARFRCQATVTLGEQGG